MTERIRMEHESSNGDRHDEDDRFAGRCYGMTVRDLRDALAGMPDDMDVTVRGDDANGDPVFCGDILSAEREDNCGGLHFAIDCTENADLLAAVREDVEEVE